MQTTPFTPFAEPSYRVYSPNEIHYLAPSPLRGAPPPQSRGWFAVGFVMLVVCLIGGGSFAALRALNVDLTSARTSLLPTPDAPLAPAAALAVPSSPVAAAPVAAAPAFVPAEATGLTSRQCTAQGARLEAQPAGHREHPAWWRGDDGEVRAEAGREARSGSSAEPVLINA